MEETEEITVYFKDTNLCVTVNVTAAVAARMNADAEYASAYVADLFAANNSEPPANSNPPEAACESPTPARKRVCSIQTPEAFKNLPNLQSSDPKPPSLCSKSLIFPSTAFLKVSNLPDSFIEPNFIKSLERARKNRKIGEGFENVIQGISDYDKSAGTAIIELVCQNVANQFIEKLNNFKTHHHTILFENVAASDENDNLYLDKTFCDSDKEDLGDADFQFIDDEDEFSDPTYMPLGDAGNDEEEGRVQEEAQSVPKAAQLDSITNHSMNEFCERAEDKSPPVRPVKIQLVDLPIMDDEAREDGTWLSEHYSQISERVQTKVMRTINEEPQKLSATVVVSNLPVKFQEDHFVDFINDEVAKLLSLDNDSITIKETSNYRPESHTITVTFHEVEYAGAACLIEENYDKMSLTFKHLPEEANAYSPPKTCESKVKQLDTQEVPVLNTSLEEGGAGSAGTMLTSLDSHCASLAFLKECILLNSSRPFKATVANMKQVADNLKYRHNIHVSVEDCSTRKKRFDEQYRRKSTGPYVKYISYLRGDSDECPKFDSEGESREEDILAVAKARFTKGAIMNPDAIACLIDVWDDLKEEYWRAHKDSAFYRKISAQMVMRGKHFSPDQCRHIMDLLVADYKAYNKAKERTGSAAPRYWDLYVPLQPILANMVSVNAELTYSAGVAVSQTTNKNLNSASSLSTLDGARFGKARPPAQSSNKEDKMEFLRLLHADKKETLKTLVTLAESFKQLRSKND
ncbi:Ubiquitin carboxyl-terminal hydrolase 20 [Frankliniella fusca]|uniref:Ubiquitin carboxyl-terminal hydrolase 20 n=1 Tax=Frankliniella fusca TaxID=407009 RepID=A0AAE1LHC8_9NEOP|nr:Ubiquitin carboxyl-terminal hydrolase 20 [Frankliniella fusca]